MPACAQLKHRQGSQTRTCRNLERGVATNPTPAKLQVLADYFDTQYLDLLHHAGYLPSSVAQDSPGLIATPTSNLGSDSPLPPNLADLTADEETLVLQYVEFLKSRRETYGRHVDDVVVSHT